MAFKTTQEMEARSTEHRDDSFQRFMSDPLTRIAISLVPESGREVLSELLKATFIGGFNAGRNVASQIILEHILGKK